LEPSSKLPLILASALLVAAATACHKPALPPEAAKPALAAPVQLATQGAQNASPVPAATVQESADAARLAAAAAYRRDADAALKDLHFEYDKADLMEKDKAVLMAVAAFLKRYPQASVGIEGNCDERGTVEFNLALGERRAAAARDYLVSLGIADARLGTRSYGKEKPLCTDSGEVCWSQNRRDHFALQ
jgi:peptidoglycan-associated lipoprotein